MANRTIEIRISASNRASSVIDRVVGSITGLGHAADGASGRVGGLGRIMETGLGVAVGNMVSGALRRVGDAISGLGKQAIAAVGHAQTLELALTGLLTESLMYQKVTESHQVYIDTTKKETGAIEELTLKRATATAKIQEQKERIRQLIERYGEEGLAVKTAQAKLAEMVHARDKMSASIDNLSTKTGHYATVIRESIKQTMSFEDAQAEAERQAKGLLEAIQRLAIVSPFEASQVEQIASMGLMANMATEEVEAFTAAFLDYAAIHGITSSNLAFAADQFLQLAKIGKITTIDLRQLRRLGIDVSRILGVDMEMSVKELTDRFGELGPAARKVFEGMSVEEFNAAVEKTPEMMDALFQKFTVYAERTSQGGAQAMAMTISGMMSTVRDIIELGSRNLFRPIVEAVSPAIAGVLERMSGLVTGGKLEEIGKQLGERITEAMAGFKDTGIAKFARRIAAAFKILRKWIDEGVGPAEALARALQAIVPRGLWDGIVKLGQGVDKFGSAVRDLLGGVLSAFVAWFDENGPRIEQTAGRLMDALGSLFGRLGEEAPGAEKPLQGIVDTILDTGLRALEGLATITETVAKHWDKLRVALMGVAAFLTGRRILGAILTVTRLFSPMSLALGAISLAIGLLKKAWEENWGGIRDTLEKVWTKIKPVIETIGGFISGVVGALSSGAGKPALATALDLLGDALERLGLPQDVIDRITTLAETLGEFAITTYQDALEWWEEHGPAVVEAITNFADKVLTAASNFAEFVTKLLVTGWQATLDWFKSDGPAVAENIKKIADAISNMLGALTGGGGDVPIEMAQMLETFRGFQELQLSKLGADISLIADAMSFLSSVVTPLVEPLKELLGIFDGLQVSGAGLSNWMMGIINPVSQLGQLFANLKEDWQNFIDVVQGAGGITEFFGQLMEEFTLLWESPALQGIRDLFQKISDWWAATIPEAESAAGKFVSNIVGFFVTLFNKLVGHSIVPDMISNIVDCFKNLPDDAADAVRAGLGKMEKAGKAIMDAIKDGIEGAWEGFLGWLIGKMEGIVGSILKALGYESPPDWAVDAGAGIVRALQQGMESQFGALSNTVGAMGNLVSGATFAPPRFAMATTAGRAGGMMGAGWGGAGAMPPPGGNSYGGDTYYVNINDAVAAAMFAANVRARRGDRLNQRMGR